MSISLPPIIAAYFEADRSGSAERVARCFTPTATVTDEGRSHVGHEAITRWKVGASRQYTYVVDPMAMESDGERAVVTGRVAGDFPGSPVDLRYVFVVADDGIAALEIRP